ncbi:hypothetical protein D3C75_96990 [compost metagenome]
MEGKALFATRAEELGNRVFDYFAMPAESFYTRLLNNKAAVLVGGRGTGKTMLLKSLAFEYKVIQKNEEEALLTWNKDNYLGCYVRADTNIVSSFRGRGIEEDLWGQLFAHYFNYRVLQQIVRTLKIAIEKQVINEDELVPFFERYFEVVGISNIIDSGLNDIEKHVRRSLDSLVRYINNPKRVDMPELMNNGTLIFECCNSLLEVKRIREKTWFILIDEYENLNEDQQRIINTLIKANQPPIIFKIAMRPGGWWTQETLTKSENLENIADFDMINYQTDFNDSDYEELIRKAFEKSLINNNITDPYFQDVENLLPELSPEDEAREVFKKSRMPADFIKEIEKAIYLNTNDEILQKELKEKLVLIDDPLRTRFHLVLIDRGQKPIEILKQINNQPKKYSEAYRHNKVGTLFLFCREYKKRKTYCGFNSYVLLSSKIMRNFVSLFSRAWEISVDQGFTVSDPKAFTCESQTDAAYDVSRGKVFEINAYPSGPNMSSFTNYLGRIFEQLNKDPKQSQPERNHFAIIGDVSNDTRKLMRSALMYSVLQEIPATKLRAEVEVRGGDYLFNRIYCPYYNLSFRKIHKLELKASEFEKLMLGTDSEKRIVTYQVLKKYRNDVTESDAKIVQMDLF